MNIMNIEQFEIRTKNFSLDLAYDICYHSKTIQDAEQIFDSLGFPRDYRRKDAIDKYYQGGKKKCA